MSYMVAKKDDVLFILEGVRHLATIGALVALMIYFIF